VKTPYLFAMSKIYFCEILLNYVFTRKNHISQNFVIIVLNFVAIKKNHQVLCLYEALQPLQVTSPSCGVYSTLALKRFFFFFLIKKSLDNWNIQ